MNAWELCPKCKGEKKVQADSNIKYYVSCSICDGQGIISSITGKPPKSSISVSPDEFNKRVIDVVKDIEIKKAEIDPITNCPVDYVPPELSGGYNPDASIKYTFDVINVISDYMMSITNNGFVKTKKNV